MHLRGFAQPCERQRMLDTCCRVHNTSCRSQPSQASRETRGVAFWRRREYGVRLRSEGRWAAHPNPCKSAPAISAYPSLTSNPADTREGRLEAMWHPGICAYPLCSFVWLSGDGSRRHVVHVVRSAIRKRCGKLCAMRSALRESQVSLSIGTMGRRPKGIVARLLLASVRGHIAGRYRTSICRHTA